MLLPVRTDTKWFHTYVMRSNKITFFKGRLKFGTATSGAPFPSMLVEFNPSTVNFPVIDVMDNK